MSTAATSGGSGGAASAAGVSVVFVTVPSKAVGQKIAHSLVEGKLAACVNIIPGAPPQPQPPWAGPYRFRMPAVATTACIRVSFDVRMALELNAAGAASAGLASPVLHPTSLPPSGITCPAAPAPACLQAWSLCTCGRARCSRMRSCC